MTDSVLLFALAVFLFGLGLWILFALLDSSAQSRAFDEAEKKWWEERAQYRTANPPEMSDSSLMDDYNSTLPEQRKDGGPKAA